MAAQMGASLATQTLARQLVSDKIGYVVAVGLGAGALRLGDWWAVGALAALYAVSAWSAYRRWRGAA
jgi:hypothetical protein